MKQKFTSKIFKKIEELYNINLPKEFKTIYLTFEALPEDWYDWSDFSPSNVERLKSYIESAKMELVDDIDDIDWNDDWGEEPSDIGSRNKIIMDRIEQAPNLIPICGHRYIAEINTEKSPVISAVGSDVIYYAYDLDGFLSGERVPYGSLLTDFIYVPFWTDIM